MRLTFKCVTVVVLLVCLSAAGCSRSDDAASGARQTLSSSAPSPQAVNAGPNNENVVPKVESPLPPPTGFVNDYADVLDSESEARLESALKELRDKASVEFAVVTIETTGGRPMREYSMDVAKGWGIGPKDASEGGGMLLVLATQDREWRLQVTRSLVKDLPDEECDRLADESVKLFKKEKYAEGVTKYVAALVAKLEEARGFKLDNKLGDR